MYRQEEHMIVRYCKLDSHYQNRSRHRCAPDGNPGPGKVLHGCLGADLLVGAGGFGKLGAPTSGRAYCFGIFGSLLGLLFSEPPTFQAKRHQESKLKPLELSQEPRRFWLFSEPLFLDDYGVGIALSLHSQHSPNQYK